MFHFLNLYIGFGGVTMDYLEKLEDWKRTVIDINSKMDDLDGARDTCFKWLAETIKKSFEVRDLPVPTIFFKPDASQIICTFDSGDDNNFVIPFELINDLHLDFEFTRAVNKDGFWEKKLIFYPFHED